MLDDNLPTFSIRSASSENPFSNPIYLRENGDEPRPEYTLRRPDPNLPASKNCYGVALYDSYNPEVLYAEVLVQPEWTQPTLSAAEARAQNGAPPPPVPIVPEKFTIQLYNPEQQIVVRQVAGTWNSSAYWEFDMPEKSFRVPSAAGIDRMQNDPAASDITPKVSFKWKRDGKLSKDISCYLSGRSTDGKKQKEPDITVAMFKSRGDLTIYQPNMHRVDVEDSKGLEVVLILGAVVIKDIFFNPNREMFNIGSPAVAPPGSKRKNSGPVITGGSPPLMSGAGGAAAAPGRQFPIPASQIPSIQPPRGSQQIVSALPPTDPRRKWEEDAETERLKKMVADEERAREKAEQEEQRRIKKMLEAEEKERRRREEEVARETERLRKEYGVVAPSLPSRPQAVPQVQGPPPGSLPQWQSAPHTQSMPYDRPLSTPLGPQPQPNNPYLQPSGQGTASSSGFFGLGGKKKVQKKRSVFF